jgi:hypothetical protein
MWDYTIEAWDEAAQILENPDSFGFAVQTGAALARFQDQQVEQMAVGDRQALRRRRSCASRWVAGADLATSAPCYHSPREGRLNAAPQEDSDSRYT